MQVPLVEAAPAASEPQVAEDGFQETVLTLLQQMSGSIAALSERVERVEHEAGSHIIPRTVDDYSAPGARSQAAREAAPDGVPRSQKLPQFSTGESVPDMVMRQYQPRFGSGQRVRLNLSAVPHGRTDGKTRGELKAEDGSVDGEGQIIDRVFLSPRTGKWKYRVKFPSKSLPGSNGGLSAFYEDELMAV